MPDCRGADIPRASQGIGIFYAGIIAKCIQRHPDIGEMCPAKKILIRIAIGIGFSKTLDFDTGCNFDADTDCDVDALGDTCRQQSTPRFINRSKY